MVNTSLILHWHLDVSTLLLAAIFIAFFYSVTRFKRQRNNKLFAGVIILLLLLLSSPLHYLAMHAYFSAHMIIHVILLLICGPLLTLSLAGTDHPLLNRLSRFFNKNIWCAWITGVGIMWIWHIPALFDMAMANHGSFAPVFPLLQSGSLLLAGVVFSWPLLGPEEKLHTHALSGIVYLFTACVSCSLLGLLITFAPQGTYHYYHMGGSGYNPWNISHIEDSEAAGLIMWVPCCFVYLSGCLWLLYRWFISGSGVKLNNVR
ncbi:cytochrome c oxidase assembly protein [Mucilaginibacter segetis]|uniref:Cytochrome c oxidase assembly protein n=1 Tax=Mucilaginibacter segetis TaxID=2793071 RepID=A0A934UMS6_9SPHI|nr:cytochrome c oxidase assembly protein [Mucilaginibacter segetis]MBK0379689.1 cytochrome c oxidase assembly protein [Mucilaginibacter segetis]